MSPTGFPGRFSLRWYVLLSRGRPCALSVFYFVGYVLYYLRFFQVVAALILVMNPARYMLAGVRLFVAVKAGVGEPLVVAQVRGRSLGFRVCGTKLLLCCHCYRCAGVDVGWCQTFMGLTLPRASDDTSEEACGKTLARAKHYFRHLRDVLCRHVRDPLLFDFWIGRVWHDNYRRVRGEAMGVTFFFGEFRSNRDGCGLAMRSAVLHGSGVWWHAREIFLTRTSWNKSAVRLRLPEDPGSDR